MITSTVWRVTSPYDLEMWVEWERCEFDRCTTHDEALIGIVVARGPNAAEEAAPGTVWHDCGPCDLDGPLARFMTECSEDALSGVSETHRTTEGK